MLLCTRVAKRRTNAFLAFNAQKNIPAQHLYFHSELFLWPRKEDNCNNRSSSRKVLRKCPHFTLKFYLLIPLINFLLHFGGRGNTKESLSKAAGSAPFAELSRIQSYQSHTTGISYKPGVYYLQSAMYIQHTCRESPVSENILLIFATGLSKSLRYFENETR